MFVKPNPDRKVGKQPLKVYDPVHRDYLPETGRKVADNAYWMRRLQVQDVVLIDELPPAKTGKAKAAGRKTKAEPQENNETAESQETNETPTDENKE